MDDVWFKHNMINLNRKLCLFVTIKQIIIIRVFNKLLLFIYNINNIETDQIRVKTKSNFKTCWYYLKLKTQYTKPRTIFRK